VPVAVCRHLPRVSIRDDDAAQLDRAAEVMKDLRGRWGVCGGWAIDLFLGRQTRPHADIDIAILRDDQGLLRECLAGARVEKVVDGQLVSWDADERLELPIHEVRVSWPDGFHLEFLLNEVNRATGEWLFRRDLRVRRSVDAVFSMGRGTPHLAPEVVLLYKSKEPGAKDEADFAVAIAGMTSEQREWLREAIERTDEHHPWLDRTGMNFET